MRTRPLPIRKSLGTDYNLRPDTARVQARSLRAGDVVLEGPDHPAIIVRVSDPSSTRVVVHCNYIWQQPHEPTWLLGAFHPRHMFDRALPGEY